MITTSPHFMGGPSQYRSGIPEHRHYDHTIPLQEGTIPPFDPIYNLSPQGADSSKRNTLTTISAKDSFAIHNHPLLRQCSSSRSQMEDYVYASITGASIRS